MCVTYIDTHDPNFLKVISNNISLVCLFRPRLTSRALADSAFEDGALASLEEDYQAMNYTEVYMWQVYT